MLFFVCIIIVVYQSSGNISYVTEYSEENLEHQNSISKYQSNDVLFQFIDTLELKLFSRADGNGDGFIDRNELYNVTRDGFWMEGISLP